MIMLGKCNEYRSCRFFHFWHCRYCCCYCCCTQQKLSSVQFAGQAEVSYCGSSWPGEAKWSPDHSECVLVYPTRKLYYFIATVTLFFLPIGIMLTAYSFIIWKLWIHRVPGEPAGSNAASFRGDGAHLATVVYNNHSLHHNRSKKKVVRMVCYVLLAFIICWMPLQATVLYSQFRDDSHKQVSEFG